MDDSEAMLNKLDQEQRKAQQIADSEILDLSNKIKFLEGQLASRETTLQQSGIS